MFVCIEKKIYFSVILEKSNSMQIILTLCREISPLRYFPTEMVVRKIVDGKENKRPDKKDDDASKARKGKIF